jgi:hypothetical protein
VDPQNGAPPSVDAGLDEGSPSDVPSEGGLPVDAGTSVDTGLPQDAEIADAGTGDARHADAQQGRRFDEQCIMHSGCSEDVIVVSPSSTGTVVVGVRDPDTFTPSCGSAGGADVGTTLRANQSGLYQFVISPSDMDATVTFVEGATCDGAEISCHVVDNGGSAMLDRSMDEGEEITVVLDSRDGRCGHAEITFQ